MSANAEETTEQVPVQAIVRWVVSETDSNGVAVAWKLIVGKLMERKKQRCVATVWRNSGNRATWHTWDNSGVGGENDVEGGESSNLAVRRAKIEASASAIFQGFI